MKRKTTGILASKQEYQTTFLDQCTES